MEVIVLLRDGTHLEGKLYKGSSFIARLVSEEEIKNHMNIMSNQIFLRTKCMDCISKVHEVRFWEIKKNEIDY